MKHRDGLMIRCACRVYASLQLAYPAAFRSCYGQEMTAAFKDRLREVSNKRGLSGLLVFAAQTSADWISSVALERMSSLFEFKIAGTQIIFLLVALLNLVLVSFRLFLHPRFLAQPGSLPYVLEPVLLLLVYAAAILVAPLFRDRTAIRMGTLFGALTGLVCVVHLAFESFGALDTRAGGFISLACTLGPFLLWGVAGYRAASLTQRAASGVRAGIWSAAVCVLLTLLFGFALMQAGIPRPDYVATWPEFQRSHWSDVSAFSIANTLESGFEHLWEGPVIGAIFGGLAGLIARSRYQGNLERLGQPL